MSTSWSHPLTDRVRRLERGLSELLVAVCDRWKRRGDQYTLRTQCAPTHPTTRSESIIISSPLIPVLPTSIRASQHLKCEWVAVIGRHRNCKSMAFTTRGTSQSSE